jgi:hypothetical protein
MFPLPERIGRHAGNFVANASVVHLQVVADSKLLWFKLKDGTTGVIKIPVKNGRRNRLCPIQQNWEGAIAWVMTIPIVIGYSFLPFRVVVVFQNFDFSCCCLKV